MGEPRWVRIIAVGSALALASFGAVGLVLADLGRYRTWAVLILGLAGFAVLFRLVYPVLQADGDPATAELTPASRVCARLAVALSVVSVLWNGVNASQHAQINRDGGLYLNAGRWIASHGTLDNQPFSGPFGAFAHNASLVATSTGMKQRGSHLEFDLSHMLSAILAEFHDLGGNHLMFLAVPIISGFSLLAFYLLANRLLPHPTAALGATATLALLMPQVSFSRDSTSEIPIQLLLFTALWILCDPRTLRARGSAFTVGLLLGVMQAMHIDGLVYLVGLPAVFALTWVHTRRADRPALKRAIIWSGAGVGVGLLIAALDLLRWDRYYLSVVRGNVERLVVVEVLAIAAAFAALALVRRASLFRVIQGARPNAAYVAGIFVLVGGFGAWFVRPSAQEVHAGPNAMVGYVQKLNQLPIDPTRRYSELSVRWISWYVGPITLTLAIVGAAALAVALVRGSLRLPAQIAAFVLGPAALLYVWRPTITPDQVWAARRFLPAVFPAVILLTFAVICAFVRGTGPTFASQRRSVAIVVAVGTVVFPWYTIRNVSQMTEQRGLFSAITKTCKTLGPNSAVVMLSELRSVAYLSDPQTLRSFCDVPVAVMLGSVDRGLLHTLASQWKAEGRQLFVVSQFPETIRQSFPRARVHSTPLRVNAHLLEQTLTRRPSRYRHEVFQLSAAAVPDAAAPAPSG